MQPTRRDSLKMVGLALMGSVAGVNPVVSQDVFSTKTPPRMPLDEFVKDEQLMNALRRGVRAMKARKPSDPLSWFYQAAIHGVPTDMIQVAAAGIPKEISDALGMPKEVSPDPQVNAIDVKKYWNQCPHFGQSSANFLPWHRGYTYYFERILRAHTGEPRFALPYWDYSKPENRRFPREFGIDKLDKPLDKDDTNPLYHDDRNMYFASWTHWSGKNLPYSELTEQAVDWSPARDAMTFFGKGGDERDGLGGAVSDNDTQTRGRLESFPHDPIHRLTGIIVPPRAAPDPANTGKVKLVDDFSLGMSGPPTAGFDPIFCIHHSNIDRLWAVWSLMAGKTWGPLPPKNWFEESPWTFFDVKMESGKLVPVEVSKPRKDYFDSRKLGITFQSEDLGKQPLKLPDPIPDTPKKSSGITQIAKLSESMKVTGGQTGRLATLAASDSLREPFARAKAAANAVTSQRIIMKLNGVNLGGSNMTGYDVHLVATENANPKRSDPSFVGSITLFRHDQHAPQAGHGHGAAGSAKKPFEMYDVTTALQAVGQPDPAKMQVLIVPFSLAQTSDTNTKVIEARTLQFSSVEFLTKDEM